MNILASWTLVGYTRALVWEMPFFGTHFVLWRMLVATPLPILVDYPGALGGAVIQGTFNGSIHDNSVKLLASAMVEGEIYNRSLTIEQDVSIAPAVAVAGGEPPNDWLITDRSSA